MATIEECEKALHGLADELAAVDPEARRKHAVDRTVSCRIKDLGVTYAARITADGLGEIAQTTDGAHAQVKITVGSDDLLALTEGRLGFPTALGSGRLKVDASVLDLLRLRAML